ncbi:MAG TPA: hypothetical protein VGT81_04195, partial [Casimicrobiaceae bacterium]|nr:hypothetical protein [Casimicrobiaceae bacterium]
MRGIDEQKNNNCFDPGPRRAFESKLKASLDYILWKLGVHFRRPGLQLIHDLRKYAQHAMTGGRQMKRMLMRAALSGTCVALALPPGLATADETGDLKAEIAAQRAQLEAQRLRLEALEKKLDATAAAQQ